MGVRGVLGVVGKNPFVLIKTRFLTSEVVKNEASQRFSVLAW